MDQSGKNNPAYRHGHTNGGKFSPTYYSWASMMTRCYNPSSMYYHYYGGKGIRVCNKWKRFNGFLADMGIRPTGRTLDRRKSSKGYNKTNCRWATPKEQRANVGAWRTPQYAKRILRLCRKPKRLLDLPEIMGLHFEVVRLEVRRLLKKKLVTSVPIPGDYPRGKTRLITTCSFNGNAHLARGVTK